MLETIMEAVCILLIDKQVCFRMFLEARNSSNESDIGIQSVPVFHLALSNMAQRHAAFCERHVDLYERHVALLECHVALHVRHVALLIFRQRNASLNCCYVIFNPPRPL